MSQKHHAVFAVYDISSSSVGGSHVLSTQHDTDKTIFLASVRNEAPLQADINMEHFVENTVSNLTDVIARVQKADIHHPTYIQVVLASPWYNSQTRHIVYKKESSFSCSQKLIDALVDNEIQQIFSEENSPLGTYGTESSIIEKQISGIQLNGYGTSTPYGKKATMLEFSLTVTIAPKAVIALFTDTFKRAYGNRTINFTTSPFTTFVVVRDLKQINDCVVIDVGEEVTDIAFIKHETVMYQHSFPIGTYGLHRALAEQGVHTATESVALLESYRLGKLSVGAASTVENALKSFSSTWQLGFQKVLENGQYGFCMPDEVIVTADKRFETLFSTIITTDPFIAHSCARGAASLLSMNDAVLDTHIATADHTPLDIPLATGALFVERLL